MEKKIFLATHKVWRPTRQDPVNLRDIEDYILELRKRHRVVKVYADPYQAMQMIQSLQKKMGVTVVNEFPQTVSNTTIMGEELYSLIKGKNIIAYPDSDIRTHVLNAVGIETPRGFRIAKEKTSKKIDLASAMASACNQPWTVPVREIPPPETSSSLPFVGHGWSFTRDDTRLFVGQTIQKFSITPAHADYGDDHDKL